ncbi:MAG: hypothetical protein WDA59_00020 [Methanofastidiosum sp.]
MSIFAGKDNELLPILIDIHSDNNNPVILDCTYNKGTMWKGIMHHYNVTTMDIDESYKVDYVADFRNMPFSNKSFDIIIFDPPHLPTNAATENSSKIWEERYGINNKSGMGRDGDNVSEMFLPFLLEAKRILKDGGIVLAKISDIIHNHRYQWQHIDFISAVKKINMTPCDMVIKADPSAGNLKSSKWKNIKHFRKCHCYWIVARKSSRCESKNKTMRCFE